MESSLPLMPDLAPLQALYDAGKYVAAWQQAQSHAPIAEWKGAAACTFAGRLLGNLGAPRLAQAMHGRAWRANRRDPLAAYFRASSIGHRLGPLRGLRFLDKLPPLPDADPKIQASLICLRMGYLADYHDSSQVEKLWNEALAIAPEDPWIWVERASALSEFDAYAEALAAAQRALELAPNYRPAILCVAGFLSLNSRDSEAIALLEKACEFLEAPSVPAQLGALYVEHERHADALVQWRRYRDLSVAIEPDMLAWWHARMSDAYYELGELTNAGEHARLAKNGFHDQIAERLLHPPAEAKIVRLQVPFVRQHDMTCAPATLSAITSFWKVPVDHLELAREICYDGTQPFRERLWAEESGFLVKEFTVTWDAAVALLDRGIPFTLATVETRSAHLQAVMGYDGTRGTIFVRDPYLKHPREAFGAKWLESYESSGPRGMVIIPKTEAARLDGIELPDESLYNELQDFGAALHVHQRARAAEALARLEQGAPEHRITWEARRSLAWYDSNQPKGLAATEGLLALYPESNRLKWGRYMALNGLSRHAERRAQLAELARDEKSEPAFWREYGSELKNDARQLPMARRWLLRALRYQPKDSETLHTMACILWDERRRPEALALYRLSALAREKVEEYQRSWFIAARHLRGEGEALSVMRERARREAKRSSLPARTLYWALAGMGREHEALAALEEAIKARPDDGSLLCYSADAFARYGNAERAKELLALAETQTSRSEWLRTAGEIADFRPNPAEALGYYREAATEDPLDVGLHETVARLLAETQGSAAALEYLREQIEKFPHHIGFREAYIRRIRGQGAELSETPLRELMELAPDNVWGMRELGLVLAELNRSPEALEWCDKAVAMTPKEESSWGIRAYCLLRAGRWKEAAEGARETLRLSIDYSASYGTLLDASESYAEKREALSFIVEELKRQTVFGEGLLEYLRLAFPLLEPDELLANLQDAHSARPDLWHAWAALITQLCDMQQAAKALPIALEAVERFPLSSRLWSDLARVHREQRNFSAEVEALERAVGLSPAWGYLSRLLALSLQRVERYEDAQAVLEEAIAAAPLDALNYVELARLVWRRGRNPRASELLIQSIQRNPNLSEAWSMLQDILPPDSNQAVELAQALTKSRGGETAPWLRLAEMLPAKALEERLAAVERALALDPRDTDAHEYKAWLLSDAGRYDEALAACNPAIFAGKPPRELRARSAWIIARRGNLREAIEHARALVKSDPDYYWAWERIAQWSDSIGDQDGAKVAAEKMVRLNPRSAIPLGYLADAMMKLNQRKESIEVLKRAFALDPSYGFAGFTIFGEHLRKRDFAEAEKTLFLLKQHLPGPDTIAAAVRFHAAKGDESKALPEFERLLCIPERESQALYSAAESLAGLPVQVEKLIWDKHADPAINSQAAILWVRSFMQRQRWEHCRKVWQLSETTPFGAAAYREVARMAGVTGRLDILRAVLGKKKAWLHADPEGWGNVGYAWANSKKWRDAMQWFGDWRQHQGLEPWMLLNVSIVLEELGQEAESMEAHRVALSLPRDHCSANHLTRLSVLEALNGHLPVAQARLEQVDYESLQPRSKAEWSMVRVLADMAGADPERRKRAFDPERSRYYANHAIVHSDPKLKKLLRRFEERMAEIAGVKRARPIKHRDVVPTEGRVSAGAIVVLIFLVLKALTLCSTQR